MRTDGVWHVPGEPGFLGSIFAPFIPEGQDLADMEWAVLWIVPEDPPIESRRNLGGNTMSRIRLGRLACLMLLATVSVAALGCATVNTVPAWIGIPAQVVAPTSLEAMAWREGAPAMRAERRAEHLSR
jgi:hypothetical protein